VANINPVERLRRAQSITKKKWERIIKLAEKNAVDDAWDIAYTWSNCGFCKYYACNPRMGIDPKCPLINRGMPCVRWPLWGAAEAAGTPKSLIRLAKLVLKRSAEAIPPKEV